jgi:hypothetical protein
VGARDRSRGRTGVRALRPAPRLDDRQPAAGGRRAARPVGDRPVTGLATLGALALVVAFASSTQDIVVDAGASRPPATPTSSDCSPRPISSAIAARCW